MIKDHNRTRKCTSKAANNSLETIVCCLSCKFCIVKRTCTQFFAVVTVVKFSLLSKGYLLTIKS